MKDNTSSFPLPSIIPFDPSSAVAASCLHLLAREYML